MTLRWEGDEEGHDRGVARRILAILQFTVIVIVATIIVVPTTFFILPMPSNADGATLCLPVFGPLRQISGDLSSDYAELVRIHEEVHAEQCRTLGAAEYAKQYLHPRGRLELEAEAYCAEIDLLRRRGQEIGSIRNETIQILFWEYQDEPVLDRSEVAEIVDATCSYSLPLDAETGP